MPNPVKINGFLGMDNLSPDYALQTQDGWFVRDAVNLDLTQRGTFKTRPGQELVQAVSATSLHAVRDGLLYVTGGNLTKDGAVIGAVEGPCCYADTPLGTYVSDGVTIYRLDGGELKRSSLPTPAAPTVVQFGAGNLPAGTYQITVTYKAADGQESGAPDSTAVTVTANSAISVALPGAISGATHVCVYCTPTNGTVPQLAATVATGNASVLLTAVPTGRAVQTQHLLPLPAGSQLAHHNGRLLSVVDNFVLLSEPYNYAGHNPLLGFIAFPQPVSVIAPCDNGIYVVADQTYWLAGPDPLEAELIPVLPCKAVSGTAGQISDKKQVFWFSDRGFVLADSQGQAHLIQDEAVAVPHASKGVAYVKEIDGLKQLVVSLSMPKLSRRESVTWSDGEENWPGRTANDLSGWVTTLGGASSRYTNYAFNSFATLNGVPYGLASDGLYRLDRGPVPDSVLFLGRLDFGSTKLKGLSHTYIEGASEDNLSTQIICEGHAFNYPARTYHRDFRTVRCDLGRGLRSTSFGVTIHCPAKCEISGVEVLASESTRRV